MSIINILVSVFDNLFPVTFQVNNFEISGIQFTLGITPAPVFYALYFIIFDIVHNGRTIGKLILGIFVVSKTGEVLSMKKRLLRSLYKMLSILILPVAVLLFVFDNYTIQYCTDTITVRLGDTLKA